MKKKYSWIKIIIILMVITILIDKSLSKSITNIFQLIEDVFLIILCLIIARLDRLILFSDICTHYPDQYLTNIRYVLL